MRLTTGSDLPLNGGETQPSLPKGHQESTSNSNGGDVEQSNNGENHSLGGGDVTRAATVTTNGTVTGSISNGTIPTESDLPSNVEDQTEKAEAKTETEREPSPASSSTLSSGAESSKSEPGKADETPTAPDSQASQPDTEGANKENVLPKGNCAVSDAAAGVYGMSICLNANNLGEALQSKSNPHSKLNTWHGSTWSPVVLSEMIPRQPPPKADKRQASATSTSSENSQPIQKPAFSVTDPPPPPPPKPDQGQGNTKPPRRIYLPPSPLQRVWLPDSPAQQQLYHHMGLYMSGIVSPHVPPDRATTEQRARADALVRRVKKAKGACKSNAVDQNTVQYKFTNASFEHEKRKKCASCYHGKLSLSFRL